MEEGRGIIQGHNQKALVRRRRVRREEGDLPDSVVSQQDAAGEKGREKTKKCAKRTRLFAPIRWQAEINARPKRAHPRVCFHQPWKVVPCRFHRVFCSAGSNKTLKKEKNQSLYFTCKMTVIGRLPLPTGPRRTASPPDYGALHGCKLGTRLCAHMRSRRREFVQGGEA